MEKKQNQKHQTGYLNIKITQSLKILLDKSNIRWENAEGNKSELRMRTKREFQLLSLLFIIDLRSLPKY